MKLQVATMAKLAGLVGLASAMTSMSKPRPASDFYIHSLPGLDPATTPFYTMHSGNLPVRSDDNGTLFFWHVENQYKVADSGKTVIWFNGGPGCSSMDGGFMEVGPYRLRDDHTLEANPGAWNEYLDMIFLDQPMGVGFSTIDKDADLVHDLDQMAQDVVAFLDAYFAIFPEQQSRQLYLAGESFAGQYIPYIAEAILARNAKPGSAVLDLQGILMGNGWIDPANQYRAYLPFALSKGLLETGSQVYRNIEQIHNRCMDSLANNGAVTIHNQECEAILEEILSQTRPTKSTCYNMYDVRLTDSYPSCGMNWPSDLEYLYPYLDRPDVRAAMHASPDASKGWAECVGIVSSAMTLNHTRPAVELLPALASQIPVWMFNGDQDLICNHVGNEWLIEALEWNGHKGFDPVSETERPWIFDGETVGAVTSGRNLTYVRVSGASHMVPVDKPQVSQRLANVFAGLISWDADDVLRPNPAHVDPDPAQDERERLITQARWEAYYHAGQVALVFVVLVLLVAGYFFYKDTSMQRRGCVQLLVNGLTRWNPGRARGAPTMPWRSGSGRYHDLRSDVIVEDEEEGEDPNKTTEEQELDEFVV